MGKQSLPVFVFQDNQIRMTLENGQPWFVARDVCKALGLHWNGSALASIQVDWQGLRKFRTPSGNQDVRVISEPAVYKLAFRSNKPSADAFTNWVASEVLPAIRKTGKFEAKPELKQKALPNPKPKRKALPAPEVAFAEKAMKTSARVTALRNEVYFASREMRDVFTAPFWNAKQMPEDRKRFAQAMNDTMGHFFMAIGTCAAAADEMFKAYVEAETWMRK